jgi:ABC-type branched-subunit amino acid transport system substrate-binding protein
MRGLLPILTLAAALAPGCSLVVNSDADQCETSADCDSKGGTFVGGVCTKEKTCFAVCSTNRSCIDAVGGPAICVKETKKCAPLLSQDCKTILQEGSAIENDDAVVLGILMPQTGENAASMKPRVNSMELARRHIQKANSGLPGINGGASRPLVLLSCTDADDAIRAARHLAEVVHVPAIIGPAFSGVTTNVAQTVTIPRGVLVISPSATSPTLTDIKDNGLVWRTAPSDVLQATAMIQLVQKQIEPAVRAALMLADTDKIKLAVVHKGDAYGAGLGGALFTGLKFNGLNPAANEMAGNYKQIDYGDPLKTPDTIGAKYKQAVDDIVAFKPHILITVGTTEAVTEVFANIETKWTETKYKPRHIVADGLQVPELLAKIGENADLRLRVLGTIGAATGPTYDAFVNEYRLAFGTETSADSYSAGAYDATLLVSYAIAAAGNKLLKGSVINEGLKKTANTTSGVLIQAGYQDINKAFAAMPNNGIDYNGASGPLNFDTTLGEAPADIQIWCVRDSGGKPSYAPSSLFFSAQSGSLQGAMTLSCP